MKMQNIIRMQAVVIGLGAALLIASKAQAQEIVNTEFNDGPYVTAYDQPTTTAQAIATPQAKMATDASPTVVAAAPVVVDEAMVAVGTTLERLLIAASFLGLSLYVVYAFSELRRSDRELYMRRRQTLTRRAALS